VDNVSIYLKRLDSLLNKHTLVVLLIILMIGFFLRGYKVVDRFQFAHDGDLYSWMVKDVVVDHHIRLIGQITSTPGIFIGPIFYYSIIPFFMLTSMTSLGVVYFGLVLSLITLISYYYIFAKSFDKFTGLIATFLQAVLISRVTFDNWIVPTVTTSLWEVWYFFCVYQIAKGQYWIAPILGLLVGTIWHINFALAPSLLAIPVAVLVSKKLPNLKNILAGITGFLIPSVPLFLFEFKHHFSQTRALLDSFKAEQGGGVGIDKLQHVMLQIQGNFTSTFFYPYRGDIFWGLVYMAIFLGITAYLFKTKVKKGLLFIPFLTWVLGVIFFFTASSKIISEYYFSNLNTLWIGLLTISLSALYMKYRLGKVAVLAALLILLVQSFGYVLNDNHFYTQNSYLHKKEVAQYITEDSKKRGLPCVAVSYLTSEGNNVGYRYLFYFNHLHVNQPLSNSPVYTIVYPSTLSSDSIKAKFGDIGVIPPSGNFDLAKVAYSCSGQNSNLTDPLLGYTE
jgi:hypothetical protein